MRALTIEALEGKVVGFCGVDNQSFCVKKSRAKTRIAFEVVEDPSDGYRSNLKEVSAIPLTNKIFFAHPIVKLRVERDVDLDGWRLVDPRTGGVWLRFGTDTSDDYYPIFIFQYVPQRRGARRRRKTP